MGRPPKIPTNRARVRCRRTECRLTAASSASPGGAGRRTSGRRLHGSEEVCSTVHDSTSGLPPACREPVRRRLISLHDEAREDSVAPDLHTAWRESASRRMRARRAPHSGAIGQIRNAVHLLENKVEHADEGLRIVVTPDVGDAGWHGLSPALPDVVSGRGRCGGRRRIPTPSTVPSTRNSPATCALDSLRSVQPSPYPHRAGELGGRPESAAPWRADGGADCSHDSCRGISRTQDAVSG